LAEKVPESHDFVIFGPEQEIPDGTPVTIVPPRCEGLAIKGPASDLKYWMIGLREGSVTKVRVQIR
jgi:hypothetical protein